MATRGRSVASLPDWPRGSPLFAMVLPRRLHPAPCAAQAGGGLGFFRGFFEGGFRGRLRWLRWRCVLVQGRWQEALGIFEGDAPVIAVALQVLFPPPHIRQH